MDAEPHKQLDATMSEVTSSELMKENALLKQQLMDAQLKQQMCHCRLAAAQRKILDLTAQLQEKEQHANTKAPTERDVSELTLQLQRAHQDLETCTTRLQNINNPEDGGEEEQQQKIQALKKGIMDLSVKLQKEQVTVMKKAIKLVPCSTQDQSESAQAQKMEKVNLHLQKLQTELLQQALSLRTAAKDKKGRSKFQWFRTHRDQEQQTDQDVREEAAGRQKTQAHLSEIQLLREKLAAEEALRSQAETVALQMKMELQKKTFAAQEAQSQVDQLKKDLLRGTEEAWEETRKLKASYVSQLEHLRKVNAEAAASQNKAEERLQLGLEQWQEERASLQASAQKLQNILREKQQEWVEQESDMAARLDALESRIKAKKRNRWLSRLFGHSISK